MTFEQYKAKTHEIVNEIKDLCATAIVTDQMSLEDVIAYYQDRLDRICEVCVYPGEEKVMWTDKEFDEIKMANRPSVYHVIRATINDSRCIHDYSSLTMEIEEALEAAGYVVMHKEKAPK